MTGRFFSVTAILLSLSGSAVAEDAARHWDMRSVYTRIYPPDNSTAFADCVSDATVGAIDIVVNDPAVKMRGSELLAALDAGDIEIADKVIHAHEFDHPVFQIDAIPFLAKTYEDSQRLHDLAEVSMRTRLEAGGLNLLHSVPQPAQGMSFRRKIDGLPDMAGIRVWAMHPPRTRMADLLDMRVVSLGMTDHLQHLSTGVMDAVFASAVTAAHDGYWEQLKHHYRLNAWFRRLHAVIRLETWQSLGDAERVALEACSTQAQMRGTRLTRDREVAALDLLRENGMTVIEPDQTMMDDLRRVVGEPMLAEWLEEAGEEGAQIIAAFHRSNAD